MLRGELEHVIRAAASVSGEREIVVVGSQAILASEPSPPRGPLTASREADVYPRRHPDRAESIDGALGEGSRFHATHGFYAHGVGPETAKGPAGWQRRLIAVRNENTQGATGLCMEPHDLVCSKLAAGRDKDVAFARAALAHNLVDADELRARARRTPLAGHHRRALLATTDALAAEHTRRQEPVDQATTTGAVRVRAHTRRGKGVAEHWRQAPTPSGG